MHKVRQQQKFGLPKIYMSIMNTGSVADFTVANFTLQYCQEDPPGLWTQYTSTAVKQLQWSLRVRCEESAKRTAKEADIESTPGQS